MATATLEERVTTLERRMSEREGPVGFLIPVVRQIHLDLLGFKEQVEERFEKVDGRFDAVDRRFDGLDAKVDGLAVEVGRLSAQVNRLDAKVDAMPRAVAEIVSDVLKKS